MRIGASQADITPTPPVDLNGYIRRFGKATGVHDPLLVNALFVESGDTAAVLASLDLLTISNATADELRQRISEELGVDREGVFLSAIHTHSAVGGPYLRNAGQEDPAWKSWFEDQVVRACKDAASQAREASLLGYEAYSAVGVNRRNEARGIDPHVPFVLAVSGDEVIAWLINYGCHAVSLTEENLQISADYVTYLREYLYRHMRHRFPVLFFNGGSGDVDPRWRGSFNAAQAAGERLASELLLVTRAYEGERLTGELSYGTGRFSIPYAWHPSVTEAEQNLESCLQRFEAATSAEEKKIAGAFRLWAEEVLELARKGTLPTALEVEIGYLKIGELVLVAVPLEIFSSISLKMRKRIAARYVFVASYTNGYSGYLADKAAYEEGGYEVEEWHKYAGLLPQVPEAEDLFFEALRRVLGAAVN